MKRILFYFLILITAGMQACKKGGTPETGRYYGKLKITGTALTTQGIDIAVNGQKAGTLAAGSGLYVTVGQLVAGTAVNVTLYKTGTTDKLKDTVVKVRANETINLEAINSDIMGLYGFWNSNSLHVAPDSVRIRARYIVTATVAPKPPASYIATLYQYVSPNLVDEVHLTITLKQDVYGDDFTVSQLRPNMPPNSIGRNIYMQCKDPVTGTLLSNKTTDKIQLISLTSSTTAGHYYLVTMTLADDTANPGYYKITLAKTQII